MTIVFVWEHHFVTSQPNQHTTIGKMGNDYQPKHGNALQQGSKGWYGSQSAIQN